MDGRAGDDAQNERAREVDRGGAPRPAPGPGRLGPATPGTAVEVGTVGAAGWSGAVTVVGEPHREQAEPTAVPMKRFR